MTAKDTESEGFPAAAPRPAPPLRLAGAAVYPGLLDPDAQTALLAELRAVVRAAPLITPRLPSGRPMSVRMTSAGRLGWISGPAGYAYAPHHPSGVPWPPIPAGALAVWRRVAGVPAEPDSCLVNYYGEGARMGLHQDRDEADLTLPVVSISLGDAALFRIGGPARGGPTQSLWLASGDVVVLEGAARLAFHGIDRIRFGSSALLPEGGRINLTLRIAGRAGCGAP